MGQRLVLRDLAVAFPDAPAAREVVHPQRGGVRAGHRLGDDAVAAEEGDEERERADQVRRVVEQALSFGQILVDEAELALLEVADAAVDHLRRLRGRPRREVALLDEGGLQTAAGGIERHAGSGDPAAHDQHVERPRRRGVATRRRGERGAPIKPATSFAPLDRGRASQLPTGTDAQDPPPATSRVQPRRSSRLRVRPRVVPWRRRLRRPVGLLRADRGRDPAARSKQSPGPIGTGRGRGQLALARPAAGPPPHRLGSRLERPGVDANRMRQAALEADLELLLGPALGCGRGRLRHRAAGGGVAVRGVPEAEVLALGSATARTPSSPGRRRSGPSWPVRGGRRLASGWSLAVPEPGFRFSRASDTPI